MIANSQTRAENKEMKKPLPTERNSWKPGPYSAPRHTGYSPREAYVMEWIVSENTQHHHTPAPDIWECVILSVNPDCIGVSGDEWANENISEDPLSFLLPTHSKKFQSNYYSAV